MPDCDSTDVGWASPVPMDRHVLPVRGGATPMSCAGRRAWLVDVLRMAALAGPAGCGQVRAVPTPDKRIAECTQTPPPPNKKLHDTFYPRQPANEKGCSPYAPKT